MTAEARMDVWAAAAEETDAAAASPLELGIFELAWTASRVDDLCLRLEGTPPSPIYDVRLRYLMTPYLSLSAN